MEQIRLQKFLADAGIDSRRACEKYIIQGLVKVNGTIAKELGTKVDPEKDKIEYKDKIVKLNKKNIYLLLNKPIGVITTVKEQFGRPTVMDTIKDVKQRVVPVGRLDIDTTGALIFTNDGELVNMMIHPKYKVEKTYEAIIKGIPTKEELEQLRNGIKIEDYITTKAKITILEQNEKNQTAKIQVVIHEGKNRQVKKMFEAIGKEVILLHRSKIGDLDVLKLRQGEYKFLTKEELKKGLKIQKKDVKNETKHKKHN